jgi:hypothetical protein
VTARAHAPARPLPRRHAPQAEGIAPLPRRAAHRFVGHDHTVPAVPVDLADPLLQAVVVCAGRVRLAADGGGLEKGPNPEP